MRVESLVTGLTFTTTSAQSGRWALRNLLRLRHLKPDLCSFYSVNTLKCIGNLVIEKSGLLDVKILFEKFVLPIAIAFRKDYH